MNKNNKFQPLEVNFEELCKDPIIAKELKNISPESLQKLKMIFSNDTTKRKM